MYLFWFLFIILQFNIHVNTQDIPFCSDQFCVEYRENNDCPKAHIACQVQNETLQGEVFSAPVPCGCCQTCLAFQKEGDFCTIGSADASPPNEICGPGLICTQKSPEDDKTNVCKKMVNECFVKQRDYDEKFANKEIGAYMVRPQCDGDGHYKAVKCNIDQTCFCINENGERIFGEAVYTKHAELSMQCECSRMNEKFAKLIASKHVQPTARCLEDGSFDPLQCMNDTCVCVERESGGLEKYVYNSTATNYDEMKCFNGTIHRNYTYLHDCEEYQIGTVDDVQKSEEDGFFVLSYVPRQCQPDGWYVPVQESATSKFCVDKYGEQIDNYNVPIDSKLAKNMNCKCARTNKILKKAKNYEYAQCCQNGNFKEMQCKNKKCYCVDEDGLQKSKEVDVTDQKKLSCFKSMC